MDNLHRIRSNVPYAILALLVIALAMTWGASNWLYLVGFPVSVVIGGVIGKTILAPDQRKGIRDLIDNRKSWSSRSHGMTAWVIVGSMFAVGALGQSVGKPGYLGVIANFLVGLAASLLVVWLEARHPDYPYERPGDRPRRPGRRSKANS